MVDAISGAQGMGATALGSSQKAGIGALDGDAFLKLMVAQLRYQSPFEPLDTNQMLQQTATLTTVETLQQLAQAQRVLMGLQQSSMAASLLGKQITALDATGAEVKGTVASIGFSVDGPVLRVGDKEVPIGNVTSMTGTGSEGTGATPPQG